MFHFRQKHSSKRKAAEAELDAEGRGKVRCPTPQQEVPNTKKERHGFAQVCVCCLPHPGTLAGAPDSPSGPLHPIYLTALQRNEHTL